MKITGKQITTVILTLFVTTIFSTSLYGILHGWVEKKATLAGIYAWLGFTFTGLFACLIAVPFILEKFFLLYKWLWVSNPTFEFFREDSIPRAVVRKLFKPKLDFKSFLICDSRVPPDYERGWNDAVLKLSTVVNNKGAK